MGFFAIISKEVPTMKIICIGDSLTFGYGVWRNDCWVSLIAKATGLRVLNRGVNGDTSAYMYQRAKSRAISEEAEAGDLVIIMGGANDVLMYGADENDAAYILKIADLAKSKGCIPVIGIQPGFRLSDYAFYGPLDPEKLNSNFDGFAGLVLGGAALRGFLTFDLRPILSDPELFEDGVHPTEEGHQLIADTVLDLITPLVQDARQDPSQPTDHQPE